jgi:hypothetical protein
MTVELQVQLEAPPELQAQLEAVELQAQLEPAPEVRVEIADTAFAFVFGEEMFTDPANRVLTAEVSADGNEWRRPTILGEAETDEITLASGLVLYPSFMLGGFMEFTIVGAYSLAAGQQETVEWYVNEMNQDGTSSARIYSFRLTNINGAAGSGNFVIKMAVGCNTGFGLAEAQTCWGMALINPFTNPTDLGTHGQTQTFFDASKNTRSFKSNRRVSISYKKLAASGSIFNPKAVTALLCAPRSGS